MAKSSKIVEAEPAVDPGAVPEAGPADVPPPAPPPGDTIAPCIAKDGARVMRDGRAWNVTPWGVYSGEDAAWLVANHPELVEPFDIAKHG